MYIFLVSGGFLLVGRCVGVRFDGDAFDLGAMRGGSVKEEGFGGSGRSGDGIEGREADESADGGLAQEDGEEHGEDGGTGPEHVDGSGEVPGEEEGDGAETAGDGVDGFAREVGNGHHGEQRRGGRGRNDGQQVRWVYGTQVLEPKRTAFTPLSAYEGSGVVGEGTRD